MSFKNWGLEFAPSKICMRILVVTDLYPPPIIGGYEKICEYAVDGLVKLGYVVHVLTTSYGFSKGTKERNVGRALHFAEGFQIPGMSLSSRAVVEIQDYQTIHRTINSFKPDIIYIWNTLGILPVVLYGIFERNIPIVQHLCGYWPLLVRDNVPYHQWYNIWHRQSDRLLGRIAKKLIMPMLGRMISLNPPLPSDNAAIFVSHAVENFYCEHGMTYQKSIVVHPGLPGKFNLVQKEIPTLHETRLLFVGRVCRDKGVHTAIEALGLLRKKYHINASLTIVGGEQGEGYLDYLKQMVVGLNLQTRVRFEGQVPPEKVHTYLASHHILVFPSIYNEPLALTPIEAMGSGIVVVGTTTGGSGELLHDESTALTFEAEDANKAATQIARLVNDINLFRGLQTTAFDLVSKQYTQAVMCEKIDSFLSEILEK